MRENFTPFFSIIHTSILFYSAMEIVMSLKCELFQVVPVGGCMTEKRQWNIQIDVALCHAITVSMFRFEGIYLKMQMFLEGGFALFSPSIN